MISTITVSYHQSAVSDTGSLHKALRDGDFETVREEIERDKSLLVKPNSIGWTTLHFCALHKVSFDIWRWIFENVSSKHGNILDLRTDNGFNCIDLFFRTHLNPFDWQKRSIREAAMKLKTAIIQLLHADEQLRIFGQHTTNEKDEKGNPCFHEDNLFENFKCVIDFWKRMLVLLKVLNPSDESSILHLLAITGCPIEVAKLATRLHSRQISIRDATGNLPLHLACKHEGTKEILQCLLPYHADCRDEEHKRLPLEIAIIRGKTWENGIESLWNAHPLYGGARDTVTKLPAFLLATITDEIFIEQETNYLAVENVRGMMRFMPSDSKKEALEEARKTIYLRHLSTIYEILRASPNAIQY